MKLRSALAEVGLVLLCVASFARPWERAAERLDELALEAPEVELEERDEAEANERLEVSQALRRPPEDAPPAELPAEPGAP